MVSESGTKIEKNFTDDEAALYDRQIRLWGVDAQKRINNSRILIIGIDGLGAEVAKNIILGGVKEVILMDSNEVTEFDQSSQFLLRDAIGQNRAEASIVQAQQLNPMVQVTADKSKVEDKPDEFFTQFTIICVSGLKKTDIMRLNSISRQNGIKFFASGVFGFFSYIFLDLGEHNYRKEIIVPATKTQPETVKNLGGTIQYIPFKDICNIDWSMDEFANKKKKINSGVFALFVLLEFYEKEKRFPSPASRCADQETLKSIRDVYAEKNLLPTERIPDEIFENVFGELGAVSAITGGVLAQEIVKAISNKGEPIQNLFIFNPINGTGIVENFNSFF